MQPGAHLAPREDDGRIAELHVMYAATRDQRLRDELLAHYDSFAARIGRSFPTRREESDDLVQVARLGLLHAINRFDPGRERPFVAFARATILGELKRHLRDHTWRWRPPRALQERYLLVMRTADDLTQELGRSPRIPEVAARAELTDEQVLEAMDVASSTAPLSLDRSRWSDDEEPVDPGAVDAGFGHFEDRETIREIVTKLPESERRILQWRFEERLTQSEIAARLGVSQMCISRRLTRVCSKMQNHLVAADRGR